MQNGIIFHCYQYMCLCAKYQVNTISVAVWPYKTADLANLTWFVTYLGVNQGQNLVFQLTC